jgi:hypothetical protein
VGSVKVNEHFSAGKRVVESVGVMTGDKRVLLSVEKANLTPVVFRNIRGNIHFGYFKTRERTDLASDAGKDARKEAVEDTATGFGQKLRTGFLAQ